jgi:hypothetical protein
MVLFLKIVKFQITKKKQQIATLTNRLQMLEAKTSFSTTIKVANTVASSSAVATCTTGEVVGCFNKHTNVTPTPLERQYCSIVNNDICISHIS